MSVSVLERPMYSEAEAARLLSLNQSTLNYWLEGGVRRGTLYPPVIRVEAKGGHPPVTWAEFVEAGLLRSYRRDARVPMRELRTFIEVLRQEFQVPYPLADKRPFVVENRKLVYRAQEQAELTPDWWLVHDVHGTGSLLAPALDFYHRVRWDHDTPTGWRPDEDPDSPVLIDPERRFGKPTVDGVSTHILWEQAEAGEDLDEIADDYDVSVEHIEWAIRYERRTRRRSA